MFLTIDSDEPQQYIRSIISSWWNSNYTYRRSYYSNIYYRERTILSNNAYNN